MAPEGTEEEAQFQQERPNSNPWHLYFLAQSSAHWHGLVQHPFGVSISHPRAISESAKDPKQYI